MVLLLVALPLVAWLGRALARAVTRDRTLRLVLPAPLALTLWLSAVHAASSALGSLGVGLPVATIGLAVAGAALALRERSMRRGADDDGRRPSRALLASMVATAALLAPAAFGFWFHDEIGFTGHLSIPAALQSGVYPPRHLAMPDVPLRYHYGFDLLTACVTALTRVQLGAAIDLATLGLWCVAWSLFWALGARLVGRRSALITPALALLAGGVPLACDRPGPSVWYGVLVACGVGEQAVNAPVASYFFQHPFALGLTLAATAALLVCERRPPSRAARLFALGLVLALLSLAEIALFAATLPAVVAAEALAFGPRLRARRDLARAAVIVVVGALSLVAARLAGGFFAGADAMPPLRVDLHAGYAGALAATLVWNAKTFGVLLPLGAAGLVLARRGRVLFGLLAAGSLVVVNGVRFVGTGDIVKFATIASVALGVLGSAALARLFARPTPGRVAVGAALLAAATGASVAFLAAFALDVSAIPARDRAPTTVTRARDGDRVELTGTMAAPCCRRRRRASTRRPSRSRASGHRAWRRPGSGRAGARRRSA
jgi:hypothetical protein